MPRPILSIVTPTREGFSEHWITELLKIKGEVEFILVHPPGMAKYPLEDPRLRQINSPFRGEIIQRMTGLMNGVGTYILTINCDEYLHPDIADIAIQYFTRFPDSWVMRLSKKGFEFGDRASLEASWSNIPSFEQLKICSKSQGNTKLYGEGDYLLEMPIAPVDNKFNPACFFKERKDQNGAHTENFDKKVWKNAMVQEALQDLTKTMVFGDAIKYVPFWCLDRLLGLFIQAKFFESGKIVGHLLPKPEQIRVEDNPPEYKKSKRFYVLAEILLIKRFPQYGYFWNLAIDQVRGIPGRGVEFLARKLSRGDTDTSKVSES
ncbi:MAG TPA: transposase [Cyanobacteria bacterium UBA11149]|nr:transposase [Cyanobacteria bacterium UBA11367]HBE60031.1 transposase [Cyanobacteria bacterium UBA11366]HBK63638.1 transposase [Cyanobacteria bacterium UBA11166]HBR75515.1 transposase [Cyanobacteria bacterium UBA11159]HBS71714.1 transposase [Cyanobacteria bacterium UBA11153]HBW88285.1 transposase [Cyanobacteria bacterium UBA11149]HCA93804.1 transposase [Cyanobacteria bacterium UBA9226]